MLGHLDLSAGTVVAEAQPPGVDGGRKHKGPGRIGHICAFATFSVSPVLLPQPAAYQKSPPHTVSQLF